MSSPTHSPPLINRDVGFFYEGFNQGELRVQRCNGCGSLRHPPSPFCPKCHSGDWEAVATSGRGTLHSYTIHHYPPIPPWKTPHVVGLADMAEGFRFVAAMPDTDPADLRIGQPVTVVITEVQSGYWLPKLMIEAK